MRLFTAGLQGMLRINNELQAPTNLEVAMSLAWAYELCSKLAVQPASGGPRPRRGHMASTTAAPAMVASQQAAPTPLAPTALTTINTHPTRLPHRVLSPNEMRARQEARLCHNCDEIFFHNIYASGHFIFGLHRPTLRMMRHKTQRSLIRRYHCMQWLEYVLVRATRCN